MSEIFGKVIQIVTFRISVEISGHYNLKNIPTSELPTSVGRQLTQSLSICHAGMEADIYVGDEVR